MNPIIKSKLPMDYQLLWNLTKKQRLSGDLASMIQNQVKQVRKNFRVTKRDPLLEKYLSYGNEGLWSSNKLRDLSSGLFEDKKPGIANLGEWISIEIECIMPNEEAETSFIKFIRKNGLSQAITIKNDGSIRVISPRRLAAGEERALRENLGTQNPGRVRGVNMGTGLTNEQEETKTAYGREIVMTFKYGDWKFVQNVCSELIRLKAFVNSSCGLHVHFDCRHLKIQDVDRIGKRLAYAVPALKQILPHSRQDNRFCARDINSFEGGRNEDRYSFINLQAYSRHQTLEIRGHGGTTDPVKIINWIRILKKIMDKRQRKPIQTAAELLASFKMEPDLIEYINQRYAKFNKGAAAEMVVPGQPALDDIEIDNATLIPISDEILKSEPLAAGQSAPISGGPTRMEEYQQIIGGFDVRQLRPQPGDDLMDAVERLREALAQPAPVIDDEDVDDFI